MHIPACLAQAPIELKQGAEQAADGHAQGGPVPEGGVETVLADHRAPQCAVHMCQQASERDYMEEIC